MEFFKHKEQIFLEYQFLCRMCDIFFYRNSSNKNICPVCHREAEIYNVYEVSYERYQQNNPS